MIQPELVQQSALSLTSRVITSYLFRVKYILIPYTLI